MLKSSTESEQGLHPLWIILPIGFETDVDWYYSKWLQFVSPHATRLTYRIAHRNATKYEKHKGDVVANYSCFYQSFMPLPYLHPSLIYLHSHAHAVPSPQPTIQVTTCIIYTSKQCLAMIANPAGLAPSVTLPAPSPIVQLTCEVPVSDHSMSVLFQRKPPTPRCHEGAPTQDILRVASKNY